MAIPYTQVYQFAKDAGTLQQRLIVACAVAAQAVFAESAAIPNHAARLAWAQKCIAAPETMAGKMIWGVLADPAIQAIGVGATDSNIQTSVDALVNQFLLA